MNLLKFIILKHRIPATILSNFKISTAVQKTCVRKQSDWTGAYQGRSWHKPSVRNYYLVSTNIHTNLYAIH